MEVRNMTSLWFREWQKRWLLRRLAAETRSHRDFLISASRSLPRHLRLPDTFPSGIGLKAHAGQVCGEARRQPIQLATSMLMTSRKLVR